MSAPVAVPEDIVERIRTLCLALPEVTGLPFFPSRAGRDRIGVLLTDDTDWEEIRELVTESYRILAPKKLIALLD